jgi:hypothetical protein
LRILRLIETALLVAIAVLCLSITTRAQQPGSPERGVIDSWNAAVSTLDIEDAKWREIFDSLKRNPPGLVVLTPDVRASQKKRRLSLIEEIIAAEEERIRALRQFAKFEGSSH